MPINLQGKSYVTHEELVQWATEEGIESVESDLIHFDISKREAVVKATAKGKRGTFTGYGDCLASLKGNVGGMVSAHFIRMAETRAINRALRLYTGRGATSIDELGGVSGDASRNDAPPRREPPAKPPHSDAWKRIGKAMCTKLTEAGYDYNQVAAWCESKTWGRPSSWASEDGIRNLVDDLVSGKIAECPRK